MEPNTSGRSIIEAATGTMLTQRDVYQYRHTLQGITLFMAAALTLLATSLHDANAADSPESKSLSAQHERMLTPAARGAAIALISALTLLGLSIAAIHGMRGGGSPTAFAMLLFPPTILVFGVSLICMRIQMPVEPMGVLSLSFVGAFLCELVTSIYLAFVVTRRLSPVPRIFAWILFWAAFLVLQFALIVAAAAAMRVTT